MYIPLVMHVLFVLIGLHVLVSLIGFSSETFFNRFVFRVDAIISGKQWERLITSGFLHVDGQHLFFNMFSLFLFGKVFLEYHAVMAFLTIYMIGLVAGNLLSLGLHWRAPFYKAAGASGGVSGLVFSTILLQPDMELAFIFLPIFFPGWLFALGFLFYSFYGLLRGKDQIGHDAHLGGTVAGSITTFLWYPQEVLQQIWLLLLAIGLPTAFLLLQSYWKRRKHSNFHDSF